MSVGLDIIVAEGATGSYDTLLNAKAQAMCDALNTKDYDLGLLHVKAVDDAGHDRDVNLKVCLLEQLDRMVGQIIKRLWISRTLHDQGPVLVVTSDHSTPVCFGDHSNEPVPVSAAFLEKIVTLKNTGFVRELWTAG